MKIPSFRITNDARECEMEENMGQVNTMIGKYVFRADITNLYTKSKKKKKKNEIPFFVIVVKLRSSFMDDDAVFFSFQCDKR